MHSIVFFDIWWNMLIKFGKLISSSFTKTIKTSEIELFHNSLLASEANSESCKTSKMKTFAKLVNEKPLAILAKT